MLIKSADDKFKRLVLRQDLQQSLNPEGATLFFNERGYALMRIHHYSATPESNWFHPCQSKSAIL